MLTTLLSHYILLGVFIKYGFQAASSVMKSACRMDSGDIRHMICRNSIDTISANNKIAKLTVQSNKQLILYNKTFNSFLQLRKLTIRSPTKEYQHIQLEEGILAPIGNTLEEVSIIHTNITKISNNLFCGLPILFKVKLTYTALSTIESIGFGDKCKSQNSGQYVYSADFRNNKIKYLHNRDFTKLINLIDLYLANNNLEKVEPDAFAGLSHLQILNLKNNNLRELPQNVLANLSALLELDLSSNSLTILPSFQWQLNLNKLKLGNNKLTTIVESTFAQLPRLTDLDLSANKFKHFESDFKLVSAACHLAEWPFGEEKNVSKNSKCLQALQRLSLKGNGITNISQIQNQIPRSIESINFSENGIKLVEKKSFATFVNLRIVNLSHNQIERIENGAFDHNPRLSTVAFDYNQLTTLNTLLDSKGPQFISATHNNITDFVYAVHPPTIQMLDLSHNQIENFTFLNKDQWKNSETMEINLSFNKLTSVTGQQFPTHVSHIWLNNNSIRDITTQLFITPLTKLQVLGLHNNHITTFRKVSYRINTYNAVPSYIAVTLRENPLICSCENEWMKQNTGKYMFIEDIELVTCQSYYPVGKLVGNIQTNANFLCQPCEYLNPKCECPEKCSCYYNSNGSFVYIDCSNRSLTSVPKAWHHSADIAYIYLDANRICYLKEFSFREYKSIKKLYLNSSNLISFHQNAFKDGLEVIEVLHLGNNLLESIPETAFSNLVNLCELYLSNNRISYLVPFDQRNLQVLRLDNNNLSNYTVWELQNLTKLGEVTLDGNPWSCECDYVVEFRNWLMLATNVMNPERVSCSDASETKQLISDSFQECTDNIISVVFSYAPIWASVLAVSVCLATGSILIFLYRREVQVLIYTQYFPQENCEMDENKKYDIFVSYSSKDAEFLVENILPGLEEIENPYSTLVHQRDFLAGGYIKDLIVRAIDESRKTLVLLSENFVQSEFCCFEFKMAHAKMLEDKCNRVVLVVLDKIPQNINSDIKSYIRTNNYLIWREPNFWKKLRSSLPDKSFKRLADLTDC